MHRFVCCLLLGLVVSGGCSLTERNPLFCDSTADCQQGLVCDVDQHACIDAECTTDGDCIDPLKPICGAAMTCEGCQLDDQCSSTVCRPDGACETTERVLYVAVDGASAGTCPVDAPCELFHARSLLADARNTIRLAAGVYDLTSAFGVSSTSPDVTLVGSRAVLVNRVGAGPTFEVVGGTLSVRGVTLSRGVSCASAGTLSLTRAAFDSGSEDRPWVTSSNCDITILDSELQRSRSDAIVGEFGGTLRITGTKILASVGSGVRTGTGTKLVMNRCEIGSSVGLAIDGRGPAIAVHRSSIFANLGGGISALDGVADLTNNFIYRNGNDAAGQFGGVRLDTTLPGNRIEHNTIIFNDSDPLADPRLAGGLFCKAGGFFSNNLIANNFSGNAEQPNAQVGGTCDLARSIVSTTTTPFMFVGSVEEDDYHLATARSAAVDQGEVGPVPVVEDFDGQPRSGVPDVGADEFMP